VVAEPAREPGRNGQQQYDEDGQRDESPQPWCPRRRGESDDEQEPVASPGALHHSVLPHATMIRFRSRRGKAGRSCRGSAVFCNLRDRSRVILATGSG
jgi:hypothetical protein